jgi:hypothetical protein
MCAQINQVRGLSRSAKPNVTHEKIAQIRSLLSELDIDAIQEDNAVKFGAFSGLELPDIICDVVDLLMPGGL